MNVELARQAITWITDHPETHDQGVWAERTGCGTVGCLAYHVVRLAGYVFVDAHSDSAVCPMPLCFVGVDGEDGVTESIPRVALTLLDLSTIRAQRLFSWRATVPDMWAMLAAWSDGEIVVPDDVEDVTR